MVKKNYCVVIGAHDKPPDSFYDMLSKLISQNIDVFIVYSGSEKYYHFNNKLIRTKRVKNLGLGNNFNVGMDLALKSGCNLITLFTDDEIILNDFDKQNIVDYYNTHCRERDILSLAVVSDQVPSKDAATLKFVVDSGMTFSDFIGKNLRFRLDLIMDQQDILFCHDLRYKLGGRIVPYNKKVIETLPIGRRAIGGRHFHPSFRLYLLTRNSLALFLETRDYIFIPSFIAAIHYLFVGILGHERNIVRAFFYGVYDGLRHKLGVTETLQSLSNNRFDN